jgi:hypothetical protein
MDRVWALGPATFGRPRLVRDGGLLLFMPGLLSEIAEICSAHFGIAVAVAGWR